MDRGKDFGRLLKKKASKVGLTRPEGSEVSNGPHSPTQQKEKKWRGLAKLKPNKDKEKDHHAGGAHSSDLTIGGEPEITLDTDLNRMEGIIDLNRGTRPLHDPKVHPVGSHGTIGTMGSGNTDYGNWDENQYGSNFGTSEGGGGPLSRVNPTFTNPNPFEGGLSSGSTGLASSTHPFLRHQRSHSGNTSPLSPITMTGGKRSKAHQSVTAPFALAPPPKGSRIGQNGLDPAAPSKDPAWHAPESWDVDKVGPEAEGFSSDEDVGDNATLGPIRDFNDPEFDQMIEVGRVQGRRSSLASSGKPRLKGGTNVFNGIGMIGGIGGGAYGVGIVGYGRLRTRSDVHGGGGGGSIGSGYARDGLGKDSFATSRKDSWPDEDLTARRPSDALSSSTAPRTPMPAFHLRVYRIDGSYHIVECPIATVAHDLAHVLRKKLLLPGQHYKLHIRERGRGV
ncbi:hypothetical protein FRC01_013743 [Tulasnella sp. 417]|nr:hypothetical protein FRC01_013743 [Tulasnella sp. 417]